MSKALELMKHIKSNPYIPLWSLYIVGENLMHWRLSLIVLTPFKYFEYCLILVPKVPKTVEFFETHSFVQRQNFVCE